MNAIFLNVFSDGKDIQCQQLRPISHIVIQDLAVINQMGKHKIE